MQAIGFNEQYGLQEAVLKRLKTMTRRSEKGFDLLTETNHIFEDGVVKYYFEGSYHPSIIRPRYKIGEVVAIRQRYRDIADNKFFINAIAADGHCVNAMKHEAGWDNKMFVKAAYMPHHIRITDIKVERLQDISDEDCMKEGVLKGFIIGCNCAGQEVYEDNFIIDHCNEDYKTAREAFAALIDKVSRKGTWDRNLFMPAYTFELID